MKIKDIIDKFDKEFLGNSNDDIISVFNEDGKGTKNKFKQFLQSSLTSLLDSIEKELPEVMDYVENTEFIEKNDREIQLYNQRKDSHNNYRQEVINIINSHR